MPDDTLDGVGARLAEVVGQDEEDGVPACTLGVLARASDPVIVALGLREVVEAAEPLAFAPVEHGVALGVVLLQALEEREGLNVPLVVKEPDTEAVGVEPPTAATPAVGEMVMLVVPEPESDADTVGVKVTLMEAVEERVGEGVTL